jgi:LAGLIDADG-like domain
LRSQHVALDPDQELLLSLLRARGLSIKELDAGRRSELRSLMEHLHLTLGLSLNDVAKLIGNKTSGYTSWLCRQLGVRARPFEEARLKGIREKRRKHERRPFDGTDEDMAYLLGLRHGDLSVSRPWKGVVRVSTSTTHPAMAELFESLLGSYGHVYRYPRFKNDTRSFEWNLSVILDDTFSFLTWDWVESWSWVSAKRTSLLAFIAGFMDAEGSIGIFSNGRNVALIISFYNTNLSLLRKIKSALTRLGFSPLGPYLDKVKGSRTSKYGIERRKNYWRIALARFAECQTLLALLPIKHPEKGQRKELALGLALGQNWDSILPSVLGLRKGVKEARDSFVQKARIAVEARKKTPPVLRKSQSETRAE